MANSSAAQLRRCAAVLYGRQLFLQKDRQQRWQQLIQQIDDEYGKLPAAEKTWIARRLEQLSLLQLELDRLFRCASGERACRECLGDCCAKGHNHMTLANLLSYLQRAERPPPPDFSRSCPFLAGSGCELDVASRPYNCISFVCDIIETALSPEEIAEFYAVEQRLRAVYLEFSDRYAGGGLTGLLLQDQRLAGKPYLARKSKSSDVATAGARGVMP